MSDVHDVYTDLMRLVMAQPDGATLLVESFEAGCLRDDGPPIHPEEDNLLDELLIHANAMESSEFLRGMLTLFMAELDEFETRPWVAKKVAQIVSRLVKAGIDWRTGRPYEKPSK